MGKKDYQTNFFFIIMDGGRRKKEGEGGDWMMSGNLNNGNKTNNDNMVTNHNMINKKNKKCVEVGVEGVGFGERCYRDHLRKSSSSSSSSSCFSSSSFFVSRPILFLLSLSLVSVSLGPVVAMDTDNTSASIYSWNPLNCYYFNNEQVFFFFFVVVVVVVVVVAFFWGFWLLLRWFR